MIGPSKAVPVVNGGWKFWVDSVNGVEYVYIEDDALDLVNRLGVPKQITRYDKALGSYYAKVNKPLTLREVMSIVADVDLANKLNEALTS